MRASYADGGIFSGKNLLYSLSLLCALLPMVSPSCAPEDAAEGGKESAGATTAEITAISPVAEARFSNGIRPEIAATDDRVFVVYHALLESSYRVKIYDRYLSKEIVDQMLVESSPGYGSPTDIRTAQDSEHVYAFYETVSSETQTAYLRGSKYELNDDFTEVASTGVISSGRSFQVQENGDEKLDDPIPLVGDESVYAITRYEDTMAAAGGTVYKVYEFDKDDLELKRAFDLDLSSLVDGGARQASAVYHEGDYYLALPTTTGEQKQEIAAVTPSDIVVVRLDSDWNILGSKVISSDPDDTEFYISSLQYEGGHFYMSYIKRSMQRYSNK